MPNNSICSWWAVALVAMGYMFDPVNCLSQESNRIKRPPPSFDELQTLAVEMAKSDGLLRRGDIIVTSRGFLVFKGLAADGYTNEFEPVQNPLNRNRIGKD